VYQTDKLQFKYDEDDRSLFVDNYDVFAWILAGMRGWNSALSA
jgi:hypothetical protein